ncbi:hypothetical protein CMO91_01610 [Candidatus Woesearchaeota archaeon]|nr:hypothetical protein [Candidatus Woesearchaeota archaeon]
MDKVYLIGSFHGFRDGIIEALPQYSFSDPREHRQSSVLKLAHDDLREAEKCPVALAIFPKGKSRGVMSYAEIAVASAHGNHLIVVDEENPDPLLEQLADDHFGSLDEAISYLKTQPKLPKKDVYIESKYPAGTDERLPINTILICGESDGAMDEVYARVRNERPDRTLLISDDAYQESRHMPQFDLIVAYFPAGKDWDRHACFMMGAAYAHDISVVIVDEHGWRYPPLQALARRHCTLPHLAEYLIEVDDLPIPAEAANMYEFFEREQT